MLCDCLKSETRIAMFGPDKLSQPEANRIPNFKVDLLLREFDVVSQVVDQTAESLMVDRSIRAALSQLQAPHESTQPASYDQVLDPSTSASSNVDAVQEVSSPETPDKLDADAMLARVFQIHDEAESSN